MNNEFGENLCDQCNIPENGLKKLIDLTYEIDEVYKSLWLNEAKISALVDRDEMYRSKLESESEAYGFCIICREILRGKLRLTDDVDKIDLMKRVAVLDVEIDSYQAWYDRVEKTREELAGDIKHLRGETFELLKKLPDQLESRETLFRQCLTSIQGV